ncbi:hypothetical protein SAMN05216421_1667 [Halopseudomonas xinjiangensis]|uniref:Uncharacterized protein n=2 Tax=Halopseudomonas xinjiangensis TaxID=487184 RepID=A0A1H1SUK0_9GAMM|nr:hypothetical protein SAMN05216421_1667 [Halopseudomonas xinjiangensis]
MSGFSFFDMRELKARAETCAETHPTLTHAQRLSLVARRDFGLPCFVEARRLREQDIMQHVESDGDVGKCSFCHFTFRLREERAWHVTRHERLEEALHYLHHMPLVGEQLKRLMDSSWSQAQDAPTLEGRVAGYLGVFRAWYDRSIFGSMCDGTWREHPDFPMYVSMIITATDVPHDVLDRLASLYGRRPGSLRWGESRWQEVG